MWLIFNEKVTEKWNLWVREQCTDPHVAENWLKSQTFRLKKKGGAEMHPKSKLNCPNILRGFKKLIIIFFVMLLKLPEMNLIFDSWEIGLNLFGSSNFEEFHHQWLFLTSCNIPKWQVLSSKNHDSTLPQVVYIQCEEPRVEEQCG